MIAKRVPVRVYKFMGREIIVWTFKDGARQYEFPDGRVVKIWNGSFTCLRCGRPLRSKVTQLKGYGKCCEGKYLPFRQPIVKLEIYIHQAEEP